MNFISTGDLGNRIKIRRQTLIWDIDFFCLLCSLNIASKFVYDVYTVHIQSNRKNRLDIQVLVY